MAVYDLGLFLCIIFHIVEWLRQTVFMTVALVNVDLMKLYYFFSINVPYGIIALFIGLFIGWTSDDDCQVRQEGRAKFLKL